MLKYKLECDDCKNMFDSWFCSSKEFERLKKIKLINCENCNSLNIKKSIMSPRISNSLNLTTEKKTKKIKSKINEFQSFINNNFEFVGDNFSYEARSIHYGNKKSNKGIYGNASNKDIKELKEEGIETITIPWLKNKEN